MIIATAKSVNSKNWKNIDVSWEKLVARFKTPVKVKIKREDFLKLSKEEQMKYKDVGGYMGGALSRKKRTKDNVDHRSLITLDVDKSSSQQLETLKGNLEMLFGEAVLIHSSIKSTETAPRYRVILPLKRPVNALEYNAITHRLVHELRLTVDTRSFIVNQMMFWPTVLEDQKFIFFIHEGDPLDPDAYLAKLKLDEPSTWPLQEGEDPQRQGSGKNQDPRNKDNIVGLFCRTYDIHEAIQTFLPEVYEQVSDNRYHFRDADAAAGATVYDDGLFLQSFHESDPAKGEHNAFDLVRIHLFGRADTEKDYASPADAPSFKAMVKLINKDLHCQKQRSIEAATEFKETNNLEDAVVETLEFDKKGNLLNTRTNHEMIIRLDPELQAIKYDLFAKRFCVRGDLPWRKAGTGEDWLNADFASLLAFMDQKYHISNEGFTLSALRAEITQYRSFHPVKEYFEKLVWDGKPRARRLFIKYLGAADCLYHEEITEKWLTAAVARIYKPGLKFDNVLVLSGPQGIGKSQILRRLGGDWFCDSLSLTDMKDVKVVGEKIEGALIVEIPELNGLRKADFEAVKSCITSQVDTYRKAYAKESERNPRQCVFACTTNQAKFSRDETGGRRWWPMYLNGGIKPSDWDSMEVNITEEIRQIWAEVYQIWQNQNIKLYLTGEAEAEALKLQRESIEEDGREPVVQEFLDMPVGPDYFKADLAGRRAYVEAYRLAPHQEDGGTRDCVSVPEIWCECFGRDRLQMNSIDSKAIKRMLASLGWMPKLRGQSGWRVLRAPYGQVEAFYRARKVDQTKNDLPDDLQNDLNILKFESSI